MKATGQVPVVSATDLITPPRPLSVPQNLPTYTPTPVQIPSSLFALQDAVSTSRNDLTNAIAAEPAAAAKARADADAALGIPDLQKKVSEYQALDDTYAAQLSGIASDELKQNVAGDLATNYAPLSSAIGSRNTRQNIQKQQNVNILRATNAAASAAATGRLAIAEQWKQYAVEEATAQARANVEAKRLLYEDNKEMFTAAEQKEYDALIKSEERKYQEMRADKTQRMNLVTTLGSFGVAPEITTKVLEATSMEEALEIAAPYLRDPMDSLQQQRLQLEMAKLKQDMYYSRLKSEAEINPSNITTNTEARDIASVFTNNKISQGTKTLVGTILGVTNAIETLANANADGKFKGISPANAVLPEWLPYRQALKSESAIETTGYLEGINLKIQQWASGAALTEAQTKQVARMTPTKNDTDKNVRIKLNNLHDFMQQQIRGALQTEGIDYAPEKIDLFNKEKTLDELFNE